MIINTKFTLLGEFVKLAQYYGGDFIYNSQDIAIRIKQRAKAQGKSLSSMLSSCGLGINTVSKMANGTDILTHNFAKIADCLDCSIDYLIGRTDNPEINK